MDFSRRIPERGGGLAVGGLQVSWLLAAHWVALIVLPYLLFAAWAGAADDPVAWCTHRCWGRPHVVWLGLANAGLLGLTALEATLTLRRGTGAGRAAGYALTLVLLALTQIALWRWVDTLRLFLRA